MTRTVFISGLVLTVVLLAGCDSQKRFMIDQPGPSVFETLTPSAAKEVAMAEDLAQKRTAYRTQLEELKAYYAQTGNVMKIEWVDKELASLEAAPRYRYIIQAEVAGGQLVATDAIPAADKLYGQALTLYKKAIRIPILPSKKKLRLSLAKFNELIKNYPTSDKIDDAAYISGRIHERFKDYAIAVLYYKRAFQWNDETPYPARYRAARILDYKIAERSEAVTLYKAALEKEAKYIESYKETIQFRIDELTAPPAGTDIK